MKQFIIVETYAGNRHLVNIDQISLIGEAPPQKDESYIEMIVGNYILCVKGTLEEAEKLLNR